MIQDLGIGQKPLAPQLFGEEQTRSQVARLADEAKRCDEEVAMEEMIGAGRDTAHLAKASSEMKQLARQLKG